MIDYPELPAPTGERPDDNISKAWRVEYDQLLGYARARLRDEDAAIDAVQETFTIALDSDRYDPTRPPGPWLMGICKKVVLRAKEAAGRRPLELVAPPEERSAAEVASAEEIQFLLAEALQKLDRLSREIVKLSMEGYSSSEIAEHLGKQPPAVRKSLSRALPRLRKLLPAGASGTAAYAALAEAVCAGGPLSVGDRVVDAAAKSSEASTPGASPTATLSDAVRDSDRTTDFAGGSTRGSDKARVTTRNPRRLARLHSAAALVFAGLLAITAWALVWPDAESEADLELESAAVVTAVARAEAAASVVSDEPATRSPISRPPSALRAQVTWADTKEPAGGVTAFLDPVGPIPIRTRSFQVGTDGELDVLQMPAGRYRLRFDRGLVSRFVEIPSESVLSVALEPGFEVSGTVLDSKGRPVERARVVLARKYMASPAALRAPLATVVEVEGSEFSLRGLTHDHAFHVETDRETSHALSVSGSGRMTVSCVFPNREFRVSTAGLPAPPIYVVVESIQNPSIPYFFSPLPPTDVGLSFRLPDIVSPELHAINRFWLRAFGDDWVADCLLPISASAVTIQPRKTIWNQLQVGGSGVVYDEQLVELDYGRTYSNRSGVFLAPVLPDGSSKISINHRWANPVSFTTSSLDLSDAITREFRLRSRDGQPVRTWSLMDQFGRTLRADVSGVVSIAEDPQESWCAILEGFEFAVRFERDPKSRVDHRYVGWLIDVERVLVRGAVSDSNGMPVAGAVVMEGVFRTKTDPQGRFELNLFCEGDLELYVAAGGLRFPQPRLEPGRGPIHVDLTIPALLTTEIRYRREAGVLPDPEGLIVPLAVLARNNSGEKTESLGVLVPGQPLSISRPDGYNELRCSFDERFSFPLMQWSTKSSVTEVEWPRLRYVRVNSGDLRSAELDLELRFAADVIWQSSEFHLAGLQLLPVGKHEVHAKQTDGTYWHGTLEILPSHKFGDVVPIRKLDQR